MISGSVWASFWQFCSCFPVIDFWIFWGYLFWFSNRFGPQFVYFGILFLYFFDSVPQGCLWRFLCSFWQRFGFHFDCFVYLFGTVLASKTVPFGTLICKAPTDYRRYPPSGPERNVAADNLDPLWARRRPGRVWVRLRFVYISTLSFNTWTLDTSPHQISLFSFWRFPPSSIIGAPPRLLQISAVGPEP